MLRKKTHITPKRDTVFYLSRPYENEPGLTALILIRLHAEKQNPHQAEA